MWMEASFINVSSLKRKEFNSENNFKTKIWNFSEMNADHVQAWSKGGATDASNCEMLCKTHNKAKGNK